jgi:hypothetical protein
VLLTKVLQVLLLPAVALLHSNEYGPRGVAAVFIEEVAPYVDISGPLAYYRLHARDYNARYVLGSVPSGLALAGYWYRTNSYSTDTGRGILNLWTSGHGEYRIAGGTLPIEWYVSTGKALVLKYRTLGITEFYTTDSLPKGMIFSGIDFSRGSTCLREVISAQSRRN